MQCCKTRSWVGSWAVALVAVVVADVLAADAPEADSPLGCKANPIRCDDPEGEHWYLSRLRDTEGRPLRWFRQGSFGVGPDGPILDEYSVKGEDTETELYLDMYNFRYVETQAVPGFRLVHEFCSGFEYVAGRIHRFGEEKPFTGEMVQKDESDRVVAKAQVDKGHVQRALTRYWENGRVMQTIPYQNGLRHGQSKYFRDSGALWAEYPFADGQISGQVVVYHENGKINHRVPVVDGKHQGQFESFFANGQPRVRGTKKRGVWDGERTEWDEEGNVVKQHRFVDGEIQEE